MFNFFRRKPTPSERLAATLRPDPLYRERRLAQFDSNRRARYWSNVEGIV